MRGLLIGLVFLARCATASASSPASGDRRGPWDEPHPAGASEAPRAAAEAHVQGSFDSSWFGSLSSNDCKGIASSDKSYCDSNDCKGVASKDKSYCDSNTCKAWASGDKSYCDDNDCKGVASGDASYCDSNGCKAIARKDKSYCP